ncbi:MAG: DUF3795 domain-containing protein [Rhodothermaceae bacterium]
MEKFLAHCGLDCGDCGAYKAYKTNSDEIRQETSKEWSEQFNIDIDPKTINCAGCLSEEGPLFSHCSICEIRKCSMGKSLENCAFCEDYGCETLGKVHSFSGEAKANLEDIRVGR